MSDTGETGESGFDLSRLARKVELLHNGTFRPRIDPERVRSVVDALAAFTRDEQLTLAVAFYQAVFIDASVMLDDDGRMTCVFEPRSH